MLTKINQQNRGGLLEAFLSKQRAMQANRLIPDEFRKGRVLDIGCGEDPRFLLEAGFSEKYGIDRLSAPEKKCTQDPSTRLLNLDIENVEVLPFEKEFFDAVTMLAVFEHIQPDLLPRLLNEIYRILKPQGIFVITTPARWTEQLLRVLAKFRVVDPVLVAEHQDAYDHLKIRAILEATNFSRSNMSFGYFECFLNNWVTVQKV